MGTRAIKPERERLKVATAPVRTDIRRASALSTLASLLWLVQAAAIASLLSGFVTGAETLSPLAAGTIFAGAAALRAGLAHVAEGILFRAADRVLAHERAALLAYETRAARVSDFGGPGAVAALASEKLHALTPYLTRYAPAQARSRIVPLVILAIAFWHSWAVGLVLLVAGPLIPVFMALVGWAAQAASERQMDDIGSLSDLLVDRLAAAADIRILDAAPEVTARFAQAAESLRARTMSVLKVAFLSSTVLELFAALGVAMVAVWVGFSLLGVIGWGAWGQPITPWAGLFLLLLTPDFFQPLRDLAAAWHDQAAARAVARDLADWEGAQGEAMPGDGTARALDGPATIAWHGLRVTRSGKVLRFPDAEIAPGSRVALTGPSGAGKSTLLALLAGLERPESGEITVAGQPLDETHADGWRARLGWMPQAPHFLDRSLAETIGFGAPLREGVVQSAQLAPVIQGLPDGLATRLGETGGGLSGGEARRVMLARALQAAPEVMLADEPTADLDPETARLVTEALLALARRGATLIIATHDPALVARMDRVIDVTGAT